MLRWDRVLPHGSLNMHAYVMFVFIRGAAEISEARIKNLMIYVKHHHARSFELWCGA